MLNREVIDSELITRYLKGEEKALEFLIAKYLKPIYNFVFNNVGSADNAEDITQEVFVKVWKNLRKFDQKRNFKPWIFQIAKNTSIDFLRKKKSIPFSRFENEKGQNPLVEKIIAAPLNLIEKLSNERTVAVVMQGLTDEDQKIINLRHIDGLGFKEIAETFQKSINTVKSRYRRILGNIRDNTKNH